MNSGRIVKLTTYIHLLCTSRILDLCPHSPIRSLNVAEGRCTCRNLLWCRVFVQNSSWTLRFRGLTAWESVIWEVNWPLKLAQSEARLPQPPFIEFFVSSLFSSSGSSSAAISLYRLLTSKSMSESRLPHDPWNLSHARLPQPPWNR
jgi:hypothetical protein